MVACASILTTGHCVWQEQEHAKCSVCKGALRGCKGTAYSSLDNLV